MNKLPEIRDIHIPDGVSAFPLAYGWWVLLGGIIVCFLLYKFIKFILNTSKKHYSLKKLEKITTDNPVNTAIEVSELLRRICVVKYKQATAFYGKDWLNFLEKHSSRKLSTKAAELLVFAPFMNKASRTYTQNEAQELLSFCKDFIGANL